MQGDTGANAGRRAEFRESRNRDRAERQTVRVLLLSTAAPEAKRVDADPSDVVAAKNKVAAHHIALVNKHLGAKVAGQAGMRANGNHGIAVRVCHWRMLTVRELHNVQGANTARRETHRTPTLAKHLLQQNVDTPNTPTGESPTPCLVCRRRPKSWPEGEIVFFWCN
jgi:hypothetical protein